MKSAAASPLPSDEASAEQTTNAAIEALRQENEELRREIAALEGYRTLAYRDALTGLWNRRYFDERFAEELSRSLRSGKLGFSLLIVDVNDLKRINDQLGHQAGDETIGWVGAFLRGAFRNHDVCCRTGGDEFAIILPDTGPTECAAIVQRLRARLAAANVAGDEAPAQTIGRAIGLSFGTASCPDDGKTVAALLELADEAMYRDKRRQKTRSTASLPASSGASAGRQAPRVLAVETSSGRRTALRRVRA